MLGNYACFFWHMGHRQLAHQRNAHLLPTRLWWSIWLPSGRSGGNSMGTLSVPQRWQPPTASILRAWLKIVMKHLPTYGVSMNWLVHTPTLTNRSPGDDGSTQPESAHCLSLCSPWGSFEGRPVLASTGAKGSGKIHGKIRGVMQLRLEGTVSWPHMFPNTW